MVISLRFKRWMGLWIGVCLVWVWVGLGGIPGGASWGANPSPDRPPEVSPAASKPNANPNSDPNANPNSDRNFQAQSPWLWVQVERVPSGDTLEVIPVDNPQAGLQTVRLVGIDAPDAQQQPWGKQAQRWLQRTIVGQRLWLEQDSQPRDPFDRLLAYGWQIKAPPPDPTQAPPRDRLLNGAIVAAGQALATPHFPNIRHRLILQRSQEQARLQGVGIWDPDRPLRQTPAEFRQQRRSP